MPKIIFILKSFSQHCWARFSFFFDRVFYFYFRGIPWRLIWAKRCSPFLYDSYRTVRSRPRKRSRREMSGPSLVQPRCTYFSSIKIFDFASCATANEMNKIILCKRLRRRVPGVTAPPSVGEWSSVVANSRISKEGTTKVFHSPVPVEPLVVFGLSRPIYFGAVFWHRASVRARTIRLDPCCVTRARPARRRHLVSDGTNE